MVAPSKSDGASITISGNERQGSFNSAVLIQRQNAAGSKRSRYTVGILCALPEELKAVRALFDEKHETLSVRGNDPNQYALGKMGGHYVAAAILPYGQYGLTAAASTAINLTTTFKAVRFCLLVGIGGGVPSNNNDIRLGDVVVSTSANGHPAVIQYDMGKDDPDGSFKRTGSLRQPPYVLNSAIGLLNSNEGHEPKSMQESLDRIASRCPSYHHPGQAMDRRSDLECNICDPPKEPPGYFCHGTRRGARLSDQPVIHYGPIASGNRLIKDPVFRDKIGHEDGVLCFEMEAAGVINNVDCLVIRGISDYCDTYKDDAWHNYASATAASYAKLLLMHIGMVAQDSSEDDADDNRSKRRRAD